MSLFDNLPHKISIYGPPNVELDAAGGEVITWPTLRAAGVPCIILAGAGSERDEFEQSQRPRSTHTITFGCNDGGALPGDKIVNDATDETYRYTGNKSQQGIGGIPSFNQITVTELSPSV